VPLSGPVPVSLTLPQFETSFSRIRELCRLAEEIGLQGVFAFDHLVPIGDPMRPVLEGAVTLGAVAGLRPAGLRVGSLVLRATLRAPVITGAIAATLATVGAAPVIGIGIGDRLSAEEARRYGMSQPDLSDRLDLLAQTVAEVRRQAPAATVWIGGRHPLVEEYARAHADGWNLWGAGPGELAAAAAVGGSGRDFRISWGGAVVLAPDREALAAELRRRGALAPGAIAGTPEEVAAALNQRAASVSELVVSVLPNRPETWLLFGREVVPRLGR
jgi:alkanesulfonate monooxygenase SsuD/methylene tetrahydromethanopterin reductase-like flavin-dependent oxidoreductase (luciferase family)